MNFESGLDPDYHGQRGWTTLFEWEWGGVFVVQNHVDSVDSLSLDLILSLSFLSISNVASLFELF